MISHVPSGLFDFIITYLRPYRGRFTLLMLLTVLAGAISSIDTVLLKFMINSVTACNMSDSNHVTTMLFLAFLYAGWWLMVGLQWRFYEYLSLNIFPSLEADIVHSLFTYTEAHSHRFFQEHFAGGVANRVIEMGENVSRILVLVVEQFARKFFTVVFTFCTMCYVHPQLGALFAAWMLVFMGLNFFMSSTINEYSKEYARSKTSVFALLVDSVSNILNVKLFARNEYEATYIRQGLDNVVEKDHFFHRSMLRLRILETLVCTAYVGTAVMLTMHLYAAHQVSVGDFAVVITLSMAIVDHIWALTQELGDFEKATGACRMALKVLSIPHEMEDPADATPLILTKGVIEFRDVTFRHTAVGSLFDHLSLTIPSGQKVGLVGFSGSGKTSFINLIIRLFDVKEGGVFIDNQDIAKVTQRSLREATSVIPQNPQLFHRTIIENIRYGKPSATDQEVMEAAKLAFAHDFIVRQEGGYYAFAGERGLKLSGGQVQRIAIARALLKNAPILILDEATSALDSVTEGEIQQSFEYLMKDKTVLVIAHRISTLLNMDRILVFDKGQIVGDGTHDELLKQEGLYSRLWNSQVNGCLWRSDDE
jgi:ATP-binding cassette subfamily B protein